MMQRLTLALLLSGLALPAGANQLGLTKAQRSLLDNRLSQQFTMVRERQDSTEPLPIHVEPPSSNYAETAAWAARRYQIPVGLFLKLVETESNWNPRARSRVGAIGLAQLMPGTASYLGVNPHDPKENLLGGARYLREQYLRFGNWRLALAAYNAGPEAVAKYNGVPPFSETQGYVRKILGK